MNWKIIKAIVGKDVKSVLASKKIVISMLVFSILLCVLLPLAATRSLISSGPILLQVVSHLSGEVMKGQTNIINHQLDRSIYYFLNYPTISLFMMTTVLNSSLIASTSFVGEKERGTLETVLFSPVRIKDLFVGKIASAFIFSFVITYGCYILLFFLECLAILSVRPVVLYLMNARWAIILLWLAPTLILFMILINVFISARAKTFQESQQLGSVVVMPVFGLIIAQISGVVFNSALSLMIVGVVLFALDIIFLFWIIQKNKRTKLFETQLTK